MVRIEARMRPGDVARLVSAAHQRGIPTGAAIRDTLAAFLVFLDEPGAWTRAGVEALRVDLGLDQADVEAGQDPAPTAAGRGTRLQGAPRSGGP